MSGVTNEGFVSEDLESILDRMRPKWDAIFPGTDFSAGSPDEQAIGVVAAEIDTMWQALAAIDRQMRPSQAIGAQLSDLVQLNGLKRKAGTPSLVQVVISTSGPDVVLSSDFRIQSPSGDDFAPLFPGQYADGSTTIFGSVETEPITVAAGAEWKILTPVINLTSVSNPAANSTTGAPAERDSTLRTRRRVSTEKGATNTLESLYSSLFQLDGVTDVRIYVNDTAATVDGRPAKSYEVVVEGGSNAEIALAIWQKHPAGIQLFGSTTEQIVDSQGFNQDINFTRPTVIPIFVNVVISASQDYPSTGDADIAQAIADYAVGDLVEGQEFSIGDDVPLSRIYTPVNSVPGHFVTSLEIGLAAGTTGAADISIDEAERALFAVGNVAVTS